MSKINLVKSFLSFAIFLLLEVPLLAADYTLTDDDVLVIDGTIVECYYSFEEKSIVIPDNLDGQSITGIGNNVFYGLNLEGVILPKTIETIGLNSFYENALTAVDFSECTSLKTIGSNAFGLNNLSSVDLTACTAMTYVGKYAFLNNPSISGFVLPTNTQYEDLGWKSEIGDEYSGGDQVSMLNAYYYVPNVYVFSDEDVEVVGGIIVSVSYDFEFKDILLPETLDGQIVIGISDGEDEVGLFSEKNLRRIQLPLTIEKIGDFAFSRNSIDSLDLSQCTGLYSIGEGAFKYNYLQEALIQDCSSLLFIGFGAFNYNNLSGIMLPSSSVDGWKDSEGTLYNGGDLTSSLDEVYYVPTPYILQDEDVEVVDGVISSCSYDFKYKNIIIPVSLDAQNVTGIASKSQEPGIFSKKGIVGVEFPSTLEFVGENAFRGNDILSVIDFSECSALHTIQRSAFSKNAILIDGSVDFTGCISLTSIGDSAFCTMEFSTLDFSECAALKYIGDYAFTFNHADIIDFSQNTALEYIGHMAFMDNSLGSLDLSGCDSLKTIGYAAFYFSRLQDINISNCASLSTIEDFAFSSSRIYSWNLSLNLDGCTGLKKIGNHAFSNCNMESFSMLGCNSLASIGDYAFYDNRLTSVDLTDCPSLETIGGNAFYKNTISEIDLSASSSLKSIGVNAFLSNSIEDLDMSSCSALIRIDSGAFKSNAITSVNFTNCANLSMIDHEAFAYNELASLSFNGCTNLDTIGSRAFVDNPIETVDLSSCSSLKHIGSFAFVEENSVFGFGITELILDGLTSLRSIGPGAFWANGISSLDMSSCSSLEYIGELAFSRNAISALNLNGCSSLDSIAKYAFSYNKLTSVDLSPCYMLMYIGDSVFYSNDFYTFNLPVSNITGYKYQWTDGNGNEYSEGEEASNLFTFYMASLIPVGLEDFTKNVIRVYPNPAEDIVHVFIEEETELFILDNTGKELFRTELVAGNNQIPVGFLKSGTYFLKTTNSQGYISEVLIKK